MRPGRDGAIKKKKTLLQLEDLSEQIGPENVGKISLKKLDAKMLENTK